MISEEAVEQLLGKVEQDPDFLQNRFLHYTSEYPSFFYHIEKEIFFLTEEEKDYLMGILSFIIEVTNCSNLDDGLLFSELEEKNWLALEEQQSYTALMDYWFQYYPEEELLAYVEDALVPEDEDFISKGAREYIAIKAKTVIDLYVRSTI